MEIIIAVAIAVIGWLVNHLLSIRAQEKAFINQVKNTARSEITNSLREYQKWLEDIQHEEAKMRNLSISNPEIDELIPFQRHHFDNFINLVSVKFWMPNAVSTLSEYETLFPQTKEVRDYLRKKHIEIFFGLEKIAHFLKNKESITLDELITILEKYEGFKIGAQHWIIKDLIVCVQNLSLGEITGNAVIPQEYSVLPIKHPRLKWDSNKNITIIKNE